MIKAPYNFVPLSEKVYFPTWADQVSQDIPFSDGEDGSIELEIMNKSPLFVRDGHAKDYQTEWSSHVLVNNRKLYFIPATTLKGCFRNVLEILSFSKMSRFNDDFFGYRYFTTQVTSEYAKKMKKVNCCGWLYSQNGKYYLEECSNGIIKISQDKLRTIFSNFSSGADHKTAEVKQMSIGTVDEPYPTIDTERYPVKDVKTGKYKVVCTGYMGGKKSKKSEYLFSVNTEPAQEVSEDVMKKFKTIHKYTPYFAGEKGRPGFLQSRLSSGKKIPVFYEKDNDSICNIGITRMFRYPYNYSVKDEVRKTQERSVCPKKDLPETIFGYTNTEDQLRGRVQFSHAFCVNSIQDDECQPVKGVFGQPRASYYPLYLNQAGGTVLNYDFCTSISGWKRYRITKGHQVIKLSEGNRNEKTMTTFRPLPSNKTFVGNVKFHNLRKAEIGALISAITFHGNSLQGVYHNLGLAKSYGYGCVNCQITALKGLKYSIDEYLRAFEEEIVSYIQKEYGVDGFSLQNDESIRMLVKIAEATHEKSDMEHMNLGEFEQFKESRNFSRLTEPSQIELMEIDGIVKYYNKQKAEALYEEFRKSEQAKDSTDLSVVREHIVKLEFVKAQFADNGITSTEIDKHLSKLKDKLFVLENPTQLSNGEIMNAVCVRNKIVRIDGYEYDIQLTTPKGFDFEGIIGKDIEVRIKQISKIGKIIQVEFVRKL